MNVGHGNIVLNNAKFSIGQNIGMNAWSHHGMRRWNNLPAKLDMMFLVLSRLTLSSSS